MTAGIEIINDHGTVLIDDISPALALREKRTFTASPVSDGLLTLTGYELPAVAFMSDSTFWVERVTRSGGSVTYRVRSGLIAETRTVTAYCFDRAQPSNSDAGLMIYDSTGRLCFDSNLKTGRVVSNTFPFTQEVGREYAVLLSSRSGVRWQSTGEIDGQEELWDSYEQRAAVTILGNDIWFSPASERVPTSSWHPIASPPQDWESMPVSAVTALVLDVTGY